MSVIKTTSELITSRRACRVEGVDCTPLESELWWTAQVIGVGASVIGDMSSRPNWGLHELDFVFSTLVVRTTLSHGS